ncbi:MAG: hypothetical protein Q9173_006937, partial [Seirophora scorigena]
HKTARFSGGRQPHHVDDTQRPTKARRLTSIISRHPNEGELVYWPKHLLPEALPSTCVLVYGYDTKVRHALGAPVSHNTVYDIASDFLAILEAERRSQPPWPLIFIAHSLGGIVVKDLLRQSYGSQDQDHRSHLHQIYQATAAVIFFGSPHRGADPRGVLGRVLEQAVRAAGVTVNEQIVNTLLPTSERLTELRNEFGPMARQYGVQYLGGKSVQYLGGKKESLFTVVEDVSSCLDDASLEYTQHITSDHTDMCRSSGVQDREYLKVIAALDRVKTRASEKKADTESSELQDVLDRFTPVKDADTVDWQIEQLQSLFEAAIRRLEQRQVICFIDALDESDEDQIRDLVVFLERLGRPAASSPINIRVCLSSRHYPHISISSGIEMTLEGQEGHDQDIANFLSSELKAGNGKQFEAIKEEILCRASGVILWVVLVMQILNKEYDHGRVHALRRRLKEIPDGLDKLFEEILTRDNARYGELILCLQWILYAKRPLKREELYYAILSGTDNEALAPWDPEMVTGQDMDKFILSCSKGLAETTKSKSQTVQFIHESVRDFLLGKSGINKLRSELEFGRSHELLRQSTYLYMGIDVSEDLPRGIELPKAKTSEDKDLRARISEKFPFLEYAVQNVLLHADDASRHGIPQESFLQDFAVSQWILLDNLFEKHQVRRRTDGRTSELLFVLTQKNLSSLVRTCVRSCDRLSFDRHLDIITATLADFKVNEDTIRALLLSAWPPSETYKKAVELVIDLLANFFASKVPTFLAWAASLGHDTELRSLLAIDAIPVPSLNRRDAQGQTLLSLAALNGHRAVVELLLAETANPDNRVKDGRTPLMLAAMNGHDNVVQLLLEKHDSSKGNHPSVNPDKFGRTPLMVAVKNDHKDVVKLLLAEDHVDVNCGDHHGRTSLSWAAAAGDEAVVKLLLAKETEFADYADEDGRTPLFYAAFYGREAVVRLLLNMPNVDPNSKGKWGESPLVSAIRRRHFGVVNALLATQRVNFDSANVYVRSVLQEAAGLGNLGPAALDALRRQGFKW